MPVKGLEAKEPVSIPADLDVSGAVEAHAMLLSTLDKCESSENSVLIELEDGAATPLAVQLVVSAARSFPPDRLHLGPKAAAILASCEAPKRT